MEDFSEGDELDENGAMFVCGEDRWGQPTLVARPCVHFPKSPEDSLRAARRCVYTMQRCIERMQHSRCEQINVIYDAKGVQHQNVDRVQLVGLQASSWQSSDMSANPLATERACKERVSNTVENEGLRKYDFAVRLDSEVE